MCMAGYEIHVHLHHLRPPSNHHHMFTSFLYLCYSLIATLFVLSRCIVHLYGCVVFFVWLGHFRIWQEFWVAWRGSPIQERVMGFSPPMDISDSAWEFGISSLFLSLRVCMCGVCGVIRSGCPERLLCTPSAWILQLLPWSGSDRLFLTGSPCLPLWENTQVLAPLLHFSCLMPVYASWVVWDIYGSVLHCGGLFENHNFSFIFMCCGKSQLKSILLL